MKVLILAAGRGSRMGDLTRQTPKALLLSNGSRLIDSCLSSLPEAIVEIMIVVGYLGESIVSYVGRTYRGRTVTYFHQRVQDGTFTAVTSVPRNLLSREPYLLLNSDDLYCAKDLESIIRSPRSMGIVFNEKKETLD